jgi:hypothetical protein
MYLSADLRKIQIAPVIPERNYYVSREEFLYLLLSWLDLIFEVEARWNFWYLVKFEWMTLSSFRRYYKNHFRHLPLSWFSQMFKKFHIYAPVKICCSVCDTHRITEGF